MGNPLQLPQPSINPGSGGGGGQVAPNPLDNFMQMFLESKHLRVGEEAQKAQTAIATARLKLDQENAKLAQEKERTAQAQHDAQGGAIQAMLKAFGETSAAHAQANGQDPLAGMMPQGQQNGQQGPQQPAQGPNASQSPPSAPAEPMQVFSQIVSKLPPGAVPDFVEHFRGIAEKAQGTLDQGRSFDEAFRLTDGLLTPDQRKGLMAAKSLADAGVPEKIYSTMLPQAQIDLAKGLADVRAEKNKQAADKLATAQLVRIGALPEARGTTEYVVDGAAKMLADHVLGVKRDAAKAALDQRVADRKTAVEGVEGTALEIAAMNPDWSPQKIKAAIKATPGYAGLPDGVIAKASFEAPKKAQMLNAPGNETQAKLRVVYGPGRAALATVNAMDAKGESLGALARLAQVDESQTAKVGGGIGTALGGAAAGGPSLGLGAIPGAIGGGLLGAGLGAVSAPLIRTLGREAMGPDQQRLWTASQSLAAMIYRPETGAQASMGEVRQTIERYIPLSSDKPETRKLKRTLRDEMDKTLANASGLPPQLAQTVINSLLSKHEQEIAARGPLPQQAKPDRGHLRTAAEIRSGVVPTPSASRPWIVP